METVTDKTPNPQRPARPAKDPFVTSVARTLNAAGFPADLVRWLELPERTAPRVTREMSRGRGAATRRARES